MEEQLTNLENQIAEIWDAIMALRYDVNNTVKNDMGNMDEVDKEHGRTIDNHSDIISDTDQLILDHEERIILLEVGE